MRHKRGTPPVATPPSTLIRTKVRLPRVHPDWIVRERLVQQLNQSLDHPFIMLSAPAGFGKTTLLTQWLQTCTLPVAWVALDERDNSFPTFVAYLVAALQHALPNVCSETAQLLTAMQPLPPDTLYWTFINEVQELTDAIILAVDDYHVITDGAIHTLMNELVAHAPPQFHLVISTRAVPIARIAAPSTSCSATISLVSAPLAMMICAISPVQPVW